MSKFKYAFPAIFTEEEDGTYSVRFPDIDDCFTFGNSLPEAIYMAEDALSMILYDMEEDDKEIPSAHSFSTSNLKPNEFVSMVAADTMNYRQKHNNHAVKKTLTIPAWLNTMVERNELNCSAILQTALKEALHIKEGEK